MMHNEKIGVKVKPQYRPNDVNDILAFLHAHGTLRLTPLPTGLYPAAGLDPSTAVQSGYGNVWVRDNIFVALAHETAGQHGKARTTLQMLAKFYSQHRGRFEAILEGGAAPSLPMNRPHVRFDGRTLAEIPSRWSHAQNDALGYFLWLYCRLIRFGRILPDLDLLAVFALYFEAIRYWEDEDSGHWEERRKVEASSIGVVVAALRELRLLLIQGNSSVCCFQGRSVSTDFLDRLIEAGAQALEKILPAECVQPDVRKNRRYDAALLFLIYPLGVVDDVMGQRIVDEVLYYLRGKFGIRRYLRDAYWTADYKDKVPTGERTVDVSEHQEERDALSSLGAEAQWCIFDPIISVIAGHRYLRAGDSRDLDLQIHHLNRSLGQLTGPDLLCPEAYYLEHGHYVPNDHVPLLWTQANLWLALLAMQESAVRSSKKR